MRDRYTDKRGRIHRVIHVQREENSPEHRRKITEELMRILKIQEKESSDGNCTVRKEIG